ncbi:MAG: DAK2 domain-containing protein, partial [Microbacterium sp.]|nr:DAK2 domain-containing protein [Microbacterium sp.]
DELNLVFARVRERLVAAGMTPSAPLVVEFMTSLDMAGVSVSLAYLDDELDDLWRDPVDSVALSRGRIDASAPDDDPADAAAHRRVFAEGAPASATAAAGVLRAAETVLAALVAEEDELGRLDAVAGDGDHGRGMTAGATAARAAVREAVDARAGAGSALRAAGESWSAVAGGTSGALWGAALSAAADAIGDEAAPDAAAVADAVEAFATAIRARGGAELGDKTMLDAVVPFGVALRAAVAAGHALDAAWAEAAEAAAGAAAQTAELAPRRGRARIHGARSVGTPDAGAVSFALVVRAAAGGRPS